VPACWVVPPIGGDVEACTGDRGSAHPDRRGTASTRAGPGGTTRTTAHHWSWWAVVRCQLLISSFEFKFDRLNMNSTI
jgi:hypothetical protein